MPFCHLSCHRKRGILEVRRSVCIALCCARILKYWVVNTHPALDLFAGTVAGVSALTVGFPFDTVKVRFQDPSNVGKYRSTFHALTSIIRTEGTRILFRGITSPLITTAPLNGLVFASYRFFMRAQLSHQNDNPSLMQITLAGAATGIVGSLISTPTELIKVRQQLSTEMSPTSKPLTAGEVAAGVFRQYGLRGLYRGITSTALRDSGYGAYFAAYEATLLYFKPSTSDLSPHDHTDLTSEADTSMTAYPWSTLLLAGGFAGVAGWIVTFPFDVIKTRMQSTSHTSENPYRNTLTTIINSYKREGFQVFFRGLMPTLIRAIPVNMVTFATFEAVVHAFS
ncbi:carnitine/acyl carnitine carrier [Cristinia sonorae]|uniref:Carnitine/acyl carnitine carrier n=1 Tax=Cristinia sonorae TaxID=1940300 RepID=A0A8K0XLQ9_9AGAR|nr:carnitine/acyl carnitine carrier [Cristinia sonorae]